MKFKEEQFKQLVEIQECEYPQDLYCEPASSTEAMQRVVKNNNPELHDFIYQNKLGNEAVALMNPLTREWAHEQFVEEEKKFVWTSKNEDRSGRRKRLVESFLEKGLVSDEFMFLPVDDEYRYHLTESEIREWGYDPERFDKEEVE